MKNPLNSWQSTLISVIVFAGLFAFIGQAVPRIYTEYFDKTEYIEFDLPVSVDPKEYSAGEPVNILTNSHVEKNLETSVALQLMKVNQGNPNALTEPDLVDDVKIVEQAEVDRVIFSQTDDKGRIFTAELPLPSDLETGNYYIQGVIHYQVRGVEKEYYFYTQQFSITEE